VGVAKLSTDGAQPTAATVSNVTFYSLLSTDTKPGIYSAQWPVACSSIFAITFLVVRWTCSWSRETEFNAPPDTI